MVDSTNGKKRILESGVEDEAVKKRAKQDKDDLILESGAEVEAVKKRGKQDNDDLKEKREFLVKHYWSCWPFASTGECSFGEECRFNHVTKDGEMIRKTKMEKIPLPKIRDGKDKNILYDEKTYSGILRWYKNNTRHGKIFIEDDITFEGTTVKKHLFVYKKYIAVSTEEGPENKNPEVIFKVYKDRYGLGAFDVTSKDGSPIRFHGQFKENFESDWKPPRKKRRAKSHRKKFSKAEKRKKEKAEKKLRKEKALKVVENLASNEEN